MTHPKVFIKRSYKLSIAALLLTILLAVSQYVTSREHLKRIEKLEKDIAGLQKDFTGNKGENEPTP